MSVVKAKIRVGGKDARTEAHITDTIPAVVKEFAGGIPDLIKAYYRWADLPGNFQGDTKRFLEYLDSSKTTDDMFKLIKETFLRLFPDDTKTSLRNLMNFARDFYSQRGTEQSYRFLFRAVFNEAIDIDYPANYLFASSDGVYVKRTIMRVYYTDNLKTILGRRIYGDQSNASALVKELSISAEGTDLVADLVISDIVGSFIIDETLKNRDTGTSIISRVIGTAGGYDISVAGKGYTEGVVIPLLSLGDGSGFSARVGATGELGEILSINIISTGSAYVYEPPILNMESETLFDDSYIVQEPASISIYLTSAYNEAGRYSVPKSSLSDVFKLHDGYYYQNFSYVIRTNVPLGEFKGLVDNLLHPAGTIMFTQPNIDSNPDNILNNTGSILYHLSKPAEINYKNPYYESSRKFFEVDISITAEVNHYVHSLYSSYTKFLYEYANLPEVEVPYILYDIFINSGVKFGSYTTTPNFGLLVDLKSSERLWGIWNDKLNTLDPLLSRYGLSPRITHSQVNLLS